MNLAALYELPIIFYCENNLYAVSTHVREQTKETRLSMRGIGLAVPGIEVDGMDAIAVRGAANWARQHISSRGGPVLIEAKTYRFRHQSGPLRGWKSLYRTREEEEEWQARDPVVTMPQKLVNLGILTEADVAMIDAHSVEDMAVGRAAARLTEIEPGCEPTPYHPSTWPDPASVEHGIRGDLSELAAVPQRELEDVAPAAMTNIKFVEAIPLATLANMQRDERVFVLGEDVHRLRGGTAGATRGILEEFPDRLVGTRSPRTALPVSPSVRR